MVEQNELDERDRNSYLAAGVLLYRRNGRLTVEDLRRISAASGQPGYDRAMQLFGGPSKAPSAIRTQVIGIASGALKLQRPNRQRPSIDAPAAIKAPELLTQAQTIHLVMGVLRRDGVAKPLDVNQVNHYAATVPGFPSIREIEIIFAVEGQSSFHVFNSILAQAMISPEMQGLVVNRLEREPLTRLSPKKKPSSEPVEHTWTLDEVLDSSLALGLERRLHRPFEDDEVDLIAKTTKRLPLSSVIRKLAAPNGFRGYQRLMRARLEEAWANRAYEPQVEEKFPETYADQLVKENQIAT